MSVNIKQRFDSNFELYMKFHTEVRLGLQNKEKETVKKQIKRSVLMNLLDLLKLMERVL